MKAIIQRITAIFIAILAFFGIHIGGSQPPVEPAVPDAGTYTVQDGAITFALRGNATTGYDWTAKTDNDHIKLTEDKYVSDSVTPPMAGVGGVHYFTFAAQSSGTTTVTFHYARPWEQTDADQTVIWLVTVGADGAITAAQSE